MGLKAATLSETTVLNFGSVPPYANSMCTMDDSANVSGDCIISDINITVGLITVSGLVGNTQVEVIVTGTDNASLEFIASATVTGGKGGTIILSDGQPSIIDVKGNGADLEVEIFGQLMMQTDLTTNQSHTVNYTVEVNEQ